MKRKIRILRIWCNGKLPLAKMIHYRVYRDILYKAASNLTYLQCCGIDPKKFSGGMNEAQLEYFKSLNDKTLNTHE